MKQVAIIQRRLTHYRVALFEALRSRLVEDDIELRLLHGDARPAELSKKDSGLIAWAEPLHTKYLLRDRLCWQPFARQVADADLVIITQENALLANHIALWCRPGKRLAFWGHGANLQGDTASLRERYKTWSTRQVDWYFAYTNLSAELLQQAGLPREKITVLDNAVDLSAMERSLNAVTDQDTQRVRQELDLIDGPIGLFIGSLYSHKRLDFLMEAGEVIRQKVPSFQLVIIGTGPEQVMIEAAAQRHNWLRYAGPRHGDDKAVLMQMAEIMLNPGLVGLGILDSFIGEIPMVTTHGGLHSPEIVYLESGVNGLMTANSVKAFADGCVRILTDADFQRDLIVGCQDAARRYTMTNMVEKFSHGILNAISGVP